MAGVLAVAALFAQGAYAADDPASERREAADATREQMKQEGREAKQEAREAGAEMRQEAREAGAEMKQEGREARAAAQAGQEKKHPLFDGKDNFEVEGKVQKVSKNSITVTREDLPAATLTLSRHTKIELDGDQVSATRLKPGQDVKASFNLRGDKAEAVEIKAEKMD
jgi:hypothetical protein